MSEHIEATETEQKEETKNENINVGQGGGGEVTDDIEAAFEKFEQTTSAHKPEETTANSNDPTEIDLSIAEDFKLQLFMGFMFELIDGIHVFIYGFISKYKIDREDIGLDENDREGLQMYFRTERVMNLINRVPAELMGIIHMEYLYFQKFRDFNKKMKEQEPDEEEEETEEAEAEEVEETMEDKIEKAFEKKKEQFAKSQVKEKKAAPKKAAPKKAAPKKAAPKKAAPKKAAPKKAAAKKSEPETEVKK